MNSTTAVVTTHDQQWVAKWVVHQDIPPVARSRFLTRHEDHE